MKSVCIWGVAVLIAALALLPRQVQGAAIESTNAEAGKRLFMKSGCYQCHGTVGQGALLTGPRLAPDPAPLEAFLFYVRKPTGQMLPRPAREDVNRIASSPWSRVLDQCRSRRARRV